MQNLNEGLLSQLLTQTLKSNNYFNTGRQQNIENPTSGFDAGSRALGDTSYPMGVPTSQRHREYFGMSMKPTSFRM